MIDSQYIFPAILSALTILATVLNFTAHFSNGEYLSWKAFNRISLATLLSMTVCILDQRNNLRDFIFKHII